MLRYQRFCRHLPQYSDTYTVKTKRGFHLYYRTGEKVPSHQFEGGDIKGERSYIIAPPTEIGGFVYRCVNAVQAQRLKKWDIDRLLNYFHVKSNVHFVSGKPIRPKADVDLVQLYRRLAPRIGRNNGLYRAASVGRERGFAEPEVREKLLRAHIDAPARPAHRLESAEERAREGLRTIDSAFRNSYAGDEGKGGLPNSVRERLLETQRSTVLARLLDIFCLAGWEADAYFTLGEAVRLGREYGLNRKSVLQGLTGERSTYDGRHIVSRRYVEYLDIGGFNVRKRGRPVELVFQAPSTGRLLRLLKVARSPSDRMRREDVLSAKSYRLAVHREYIRRLAPRSSLSALARRIGVNERTIRRYNAALDVKLSACVGRLNLSREVVSSLPRRRWGTRRNSTRGFWLETGDGSRLPAWRHIGAKLLKVGDVGAGLCLRRASVFSLRPDAIAGALFEEMSVAQFRRHLILRGESPGGMGLAERLGAALESMRGRTVAAGYEKIQLFFDDVAARIADDKVAETINGFLFARDEGGGEVRRPARRGIAYRMLKEHGNGNVYLALRSSYRDMMLSMARHALRAGDTAESLELLGRSVG